MMPDLVGRREIADRAGTTPGLVDAWRRRHADFPQPEWVVSGTPIWRWETVAAWLAKPRPTGRPRRCAVPTADPFLLPLSCRHLTSVRQ